MLRFYAEEIEKTLKGFGLKVDLMFPKPEVQASVFIDHLCKSGAKFAVVIRPDNEAHKSVTVHCIRQAKVEGNVSACCSKIYLIKLWIYLFC